MSEDTDTHTILVLFDDPWITHSALDPFGNEPRPCRAINGKYQQTWPVLVELKNTGRKFRKPVLVWVSFSARLLPVSGSTEWVTGLGKEGPESFSSFLLVFGFWVFGRALAWMNGRIIFG